MNTYPGKRSVAGRYLGVTLVLLSCVVANPPAVKADDLKIVTTISVRSAVTSPFQITHRGKITAIRNKRVPIERRGGGSLREAVEDVTARMARAGYRLGRTFTRQGRTYGVFQRRETVGSVVFVARYNAKSRMRSRRQGNRRVKALQIKLTRLRVDARNVNFNADFPQERRQRGLQIAKQRFMEELVRLERRTDGTPHYLSRGEDATLEQAYTRPAQFQKRIALKIFGSTAYTLVATVRAKPDRRMIEGHIGSVGR